MFNVIQVWANWDAEFEKVVATFPSEEEAEQEAKQRRTAGGPGSGFIARAAENGCVPHSPVTDAA